jgi:hypothetical protein
MPITHRIPGLLLTDHDFQVPIDHSQPDGARLTVFAREVVAASKASADLPWLVFFQGGPGYGAPRPIDAATPEWIGRAVKDYRVLLLDQRGTDAAARSAFNLWRASNRRRNRPII